MRILLGVASLVAVGLSGPATLLSGGTHANAAADSSLRNLVSADTARPKTVDDTAGSSDTERGAVIPGYLSSWGLPPVPGQFTITDTGLVFRSASSSPSTFVSSVSLAYVVDENGRTHYLFRISGGVFESDAPGPLLEAALHSRAAGGLKPVRLATNEGFLDAADQTAPLKAVRRISASSYADSLYGLFGKPRAPLGMIGRRGRAAGRLGEYIVARDSLALDPGRMTSEAQLRHALAHELGHRWQARANAQVAALWSGVPAIRDPKRYGYSDRSEHQAEAIAFAVNFLQTTATSAGTVAGSLTLLDHYELLVPGTRTIVRYLSLQPTYRHHPLRSLLTTPRITYALEK